MVTLLFNMFIITVVTPFMFFPSFFANCPECYINFVMDFTQAVPLSYKYL